MNRGGKTFKPYHRSREHHGPDSKHRLDLAKEVQDLRGKTDVVPGLGIRAMPSLNDVRPMQQFRRKKGMKHREEKDQRRHPIERLRDEAAMNHVPSSSGARITVIRQRARELFSFGRLRPTYERHEREAQGTLTRVTKRSGHRSNGVRSDKL